MTDDVNNHSGVNSVGSQANTSAAAPQYIKPTNGISSMLNLDNLIPFGLFAVGVIVVYMLSLRTGPNTASAEQELMEAQIDSALVQLQSVQNQTSEDILQRFEYDITTRQVPPRRLNGNPFIFYPPSQRSDPKPLATDDSSKPDEPLGRELSHAITLAEQLELQSVLTGKHGKTAMISGNLITEGQKIEGWTVTKIQPRKVTLEWKGRTHTLEMPKFR